MAQPSVAFVHPDLGIGGAERLVVDAAVSLKHCGHDVRIITSHYDAQHAFEPTYDGTLTVVHAKTRVPRAVLHKFHLPMAILQQLSLVFQVCVAAYCASLATSAPGVYAWLSSIPPSALPDVFVVDQLPIAIPLLKMLCARRVLYYCHFPDKKISASLAEQRGSTGWIRTLYRLPFDWLEERTTAFSDSIVANSKFTARHFQHAFPHIRTPPHVIYPGVDEEAYQSRDVAQALLEYEKHHTDSRERQVQRAVNDVLSARDRPTFLSINRFEAKKNIALAIESFARLRRAKGCRQIRLICTGGYDRRVQDNVETLAALQAQATQLNLPHATIWCNAPMYEPPCSPPSTKDLAKAAVLFFPSFPGPLLHKLLVSPTVHALLYTPTNEHFGIVPLEAMVCGVPVIATNTGGPLETVIDARVDEQGTVRSPDATGFLLPEDPDLWADACATILSWDMRTIERVAANAKRRVADVFSVDAMGAALHQDVRHLGAMGRVSFAERAQVLVLGVGILALISAVLASFVALKWHW